jgi:hypothetical protein
LAVDVKAELHVGAYQLIAAVGLVMLARDPAVRVFRTTLPLMFAQTQFRVTGGLAALF